MFGEPINGPFLPGQEVDWTYGPWPCLPQRRVIVHPRNLPPAGVGQTRFYVITTGAEVGIFSSE